MLIIFILINTKSLLVFHLKREDILFACHSNPEIIVNHIESNDHIESLNNHIESLESELNDAKEEIRNLKTFLNQNSQNSNKPPSTDSFVKKKTKSDEKKSDRRPGGKKGHPGSTLKFFDSPHEIVNHYRCNCEYCGHNLLQTEAKGYERRQEVDLLP